MNNINMSDRDIRELRRLDVENEILELIEDSQDMTQSDIQGAVMALVNKYFV